MAKRALKGLLPRSWRAALLGVFALFTAMPAFATEDDITGTWRVETNVFEADCKIEGTFTFTPTSVRNSYNCRFTTTQTCTRGGRSAVTVEQSCTAQRVGRQVAIKSRVERIVRREPEEIGSRYYADNFIVSITRPGAEMVGGHYDEVRQLQARFWRVRELTS
jgi:hypothetical protein